MPDWTLQEKVTIGEEFVDLLWYEPQICCTWSSMTDLGNMKYKFQVNGCRIKGTLKYVGCLLLFECGELQRTFYKHIGSVAVAVTPEHMAQMLKDILMEYSCAFLGKVDWQKEGF